MCEFCESGKELFTSIYCDLRIDNDIPYIGPSLTVFNITKHCPKFSDCSARAMNVEVHFPIKFCPECGKSLKSED